MGRPKATLPIGSETFLGRLIRIYSPYCSPVVVVLGAGHADAEIRRAHQHFPVTFALNPEPERGQFSSLQTGLAVVPAGQAVLFQPVDYPAVAEETVARLAATGAPLAIPTFEGRRGHPIRLGPALAEELRQAPPDAQARDYIRPHYGEAAFVPVADVGITQDIDTPEEYSRWLA